MVADGAHILVSLALVLVVLRARRPEPYLVAALASSIPDADKFVLAPLAELGYLEGAIWFHRGVTHSLLFAALLVVVLSLFGPRRAAVIGVASHLLLDFLTGGIRPFVPVDGGLYGLGVSWLVLTVLSLVGSVTIILSGLFHSRYRSRVESLLSRSGIRQSDWFG